MSVSAFLEQNFRHFNARETLAAARAYKQHVESGNKMLLAMGGAMSTAEIGITLARMIREDKVHAISCTAANYEEDIFNLFAHDDYRFVPNYRALTAQDELRLRDEGFNRVTDTCIPETAIRSIEHHVLEMWRRAGEKGERCFPYEFLAQVLRAGSLKDHYQIPAENSWVLAALEKDLPIYTPGFEDSTLGNILAARVIDGSLPHHNMVRSGTEQMEHLVRWYLKMVESRSVGFFQIAGGIAGDFPICAVPLIRQDLHQDTPLWSYFAQISDSTTSYGSYSGAVPNEKITWHKLGVDSPKFMINSDASIVAPLIFAYVLGL